MAGCFWSLLFLIGFTILHAANADPPQTLKRYSACISPCFAACDPDYDAQCVCNLLVQDPDGVDAAVACFGRYCNPDFATAIFPDFGRECSIFLGTPIVYNGTAIKTLTASASTVETATLTSTYIPELTPTPTPTPDLNTTSTALSSAAQTGSALPAESGSQDSDPKTAVEGGTPRPVLAVYVLVPIAIVVLGVAAFFVWRRKHQQQSTITAAAWDSSQNPIVGEAATPRGEGGGGFTIRIVPRSISQIGGRTPSPRPAYPPPARQPSIGRRARDFARRLMDKELPGLPLSLSITTISEVEEAYPRPPPERDARTHRTTDSEDELRRVYREVRKGFRSESTASSAITSLDWSMMGGASQAPGTKEPYV